MSRAGPPAGGGPWALPAPRFAADILAASGRPLHPQAVQYLAVLRGLKPLLDDWVPLARYADFERACRRHGLWVRRGATFLMVDRERIPPGVRDAERVTTTSAFGLPADARGVRRGQAHVYVSRERGLLRHGMWYPLIVKDRVLSPLYADSLAYGETLGYPPCCVRFFRQRNNWSRYSFLWEVFKNTRGRPHLLCNPLLKDACVSYSYHMPCSFRCAASLRAAARLRAEVRRADPAYARAADRALSGVFLVLYERQAWKLDGRLRGGRARYRGFAAAPPAAPFPALERALAAGDEARLAGRRVVVSRGGREAGSVRVPLERRAPQLMFLTEFGDG